MTNTNSTPNQNTGDPLYPTLEDGEKQKLLINYVTDNPEEAVYEEDKEKTKGVFYEVMLVVLPLFCGYACLFALQREVKQVYGIEDNNSARSHQFGAAASLVYIGNFVFRMGHNVLFFFAPPRIRVLISMSSMGISMGILAAVFFLFDRSNLSLAWVFLAYGFGGLGIGTFESNLLSTIAPLGKETKFWAIIAIPVGINIITVGGFLLLEAGVSAGYIYFVVMLLVFGGIAVYFVRIYKEAGTATAITLPEFFSELRQWRSWFPFIQWHCVALLVDMFCVSMFSPGVMLYIYDNKYVSFPWFRGKLKKDYVFSIYDMGFFIGDTISRKIFYPRKIVFPLFFWVFAVIGVACGLSNVSELIFFCGFLVAFCNGSIYAQANRRIDSSIDKKHSLIAFSCWLFVGDMGSVLGSNLISYVSVAVKNAYHTNTTS